MAKKCGVTVKDMYWTLGAYDVVAICEAPDDEAATALSMAFARVALYAPRPCAPSPPTMKKILAPGLSLGFEGPSS